MVCHKAEKRSNNSIICEINFLSQAKVKKTNKSHSDNGKLSIDAIYGNNSHPNNRNESSYSLLLKFCSFATKHTHKINVKRYKLFIPTNSAKETSGQKNMFFLLKKLEADLSLVGWMVGWLVGVSVCDLILCAFI